MKRTFSLLLAVLLWAGLLTPTLAVETDRTITFFSNPYTHQLLFVASGTDLPYCWQESDGVRIDCPLPASLSCTLEGGGVYQCPIQWDDMTALAADGSAYHLSGTLQPENGYALAAGLTAPYVSVFPIAEGMPVQAITQFSVRMPLLGLLLEKGSPLPQQSILPATACCMIAGAAESFMLPLAWDWSGVNSKASGLYSVTGAFRALPGCFTFSDSFPSYPVSVMANDAIDLSYCSGRDRMGNLIFQWLWADADISQMKLYYKVGQTGEWSYCPGEQVSIFPEGMLLAEEAAAIYTTGSLSIMLPDLPSDNPCFFQFEYDGQYSNVLQVNVSQAGGHSYLIGGDRGVSDRGDQTLPGFGQIAPSVPSEPSIPDTGMAILPIEETLPHQETPAMESLTDTTTVLSGKRLRSLLAANGSTVLFEKQGISVELPSSFLSGLALADTSLLTVVIEKPESRAFRLQLFRDEESLTTLQETAVSMVFQPKQGEELSRLACYDVNGNLVSRVSYDAENGLLHFTIPAAGTYAVTASPKEEEEEEEEEILPKEDAPADSSTGSIPRQSRNQLFLILAAFGIVGAAVVLASFLRRRSHHE